MGTEVPQALGLSQLGLALLSSETLAVTLGLIQVKVLHFSKLLPVTSDHNPDTCLSQDTMTSFCYLSR